MNKILDYCYCGQKIKIETADEASAMIATMKVYMNKLHRGYDGECYKLWYLSDTPYAELVKMLTLPNDFGLHQKVFRVIKHTIDRGSGIWLLVEMRDEIPIEYLREGWNASPAWMSKFMVDYMRELVEVGDICAAFRALKLVLDSPQCVEFAINELFPALTRL